ncbi:MAG: hypothetical protein ACK5Z5_06680 [Neisseriaceae bacterium]
MEDKKSTYRIPRFLKLQPRDMVIFEFLDRVGYAHLRHITAACGIESDEKGQAAVLRRLYLLRKFEYIKSFGTHIGNYYALDKRGKLKNALISSVKLDQLENHDFLVDLFFCVKDAGIVLTERECIAKYKVVGKTGRVPDMQIDDYVVEYERDYRSAAEISMLINYWTIEQGKNLCIVYTNEEINSRYSRLMNVKVKLIAKDNYKDILRIISKRETEEDKGQLDDKANVITREQTKVGNILDKYK